MKLFKTLLFAVIFGLVIPVCLATGDNSTEMYTRSQVDSIVTAEIQRQVSVELVDLKIDKAANEKLDRLQAEHDDLITQQITLIGVIFTSLAAIIGILIPLLLEKMKERRLRQMSREADKKLKDLEERIYAAENSARQAYFSEMVTCALYEEDFDTQIENAKKIIEKFRYDEQYCPQAYFVRGTIYGKNGKYEMAINDFTEAIIRNPKDADAYISRGNSYGNKGDYDQAIKDFTEAINLIPDNANAYIGRGVIYLRKGYFDKAIEDYTKAITISSESSIAYNNRGLSRYHREEYDDAIEDCNAAIRINPNSFDAYNIRGLSYDSKSDKNNAIADFSEALKKAQKVQDFVLAFSNRGLSYYHNGEYGKAINDCTWAIQIDSDCVEAYNTRGLSYDKEGKYDKAIENFTEAIKRKPDYYRAIVNRSYSYFNNGDHEKALDDSTEAIKINPNDCFVYNKRCEVFMKLLRWDDALNDAKKGMKIAIRERKEDYVAVFNQIINEIDKTHKAQK